MTFTHLSTFPGSGKPTPEVYPCLLPTVLCTSIGVKRKRSTDIEPTEMHQATSQMKQITPSAKEGRSNRDHEQHKTSEKPKIEVSVKNE